MTMITRRKFLKAAASLGACLAWRSGGGPLAYRVAHRVKHWNPARLHRQNQAKLEGKIPTDEQ